MGTHIVKEGNSFYEIDEDCLHAKRKREKTAEGSSGREDPGNARAEEKNGEKASK